MTVCTNHIICKICEIYDIILPKENRRYEHFNV